MAGKRESDAIDVERLDSGDEQEAESRREDSESPSEASTRLPVPSFDLLGDEETPRRKPVEPRPYIEIRPSETTIDPDAVANAMNLLHAQLTDHTKTGLTNRLFRSVQIPLVEWLLVSDGRPDPQMRYLVGTTHSDFTDDLRAALRTCFPDSYEFRTVEWHPRYAEEYLPVPTLDSEPYAIEFPTGATMDTSVEPYVSGVEYRGHTSRRHDWQTPLDSVRDRTSTTGRARDSRVRSDDHRGPREHRAESHRVPLASVIETVSDADVPVIYQVVCKVHEDWTGRAERYLRRLEEGRVTVTDRLLDTVFPRSREERQAYEPDFADRTRIEAISTRDFSRTFCVSARAVALTRDDPGLADTVARRLASALRTIDGRHHTIEGHVAADGELHSKAAPPGSSIYEDLRSRAVYPVTYDSPRSRLPWKEPQSKGIVVAPAELPGFCLVDGAGLTPDGQRALEARRRERAALTLPPAQQLARYTRPGMALCMPLTHDRRQYGQPLYLQPSQQDRHLVVIGETGSGKSVLMEGAVLTNASATAGPDILFDYKGGGTAEEYLQIHYAIHGDLDDVLYFDLSQVLPAFSFFDIRPLLEAGVPREEARSRKAGHYEEILQGLMGAEKYGEAAESVKAIRNHLRALYDPVHGADAVSHADLYHALQRSQRGDSMPPTTDDKLTAYFEGLTERDRDIFNKVMGGAVGRVETIATDGRLAPVFDHVPDGDGEEPDPHFDFANHLDEDRVIVFDFGGMEDTVKRTLTIVILSNLWTALKAREQNARRSDRDRNLPLVNLYLEEARDVGATRLLDTLLAEGRSFGLSVALGLQFPEQLESPDADRDTYREALNETATFVVGNVSVDTDLPRVLATESMEPDAVARRLSSMGRGEWLVRPGTDFGEEPVKPFLAESLPAPPGHPAGSEPLSASERRQFQEAFETLQRETAGVAGLTHEETSWDGDEPPTEDQDDETDTEEPTIEDSGPTRPEHRVDTLLPHTQRMPEHVSYDHRRDAIRCERCGNRYDPAIEGMTRAIECCYSLEAVDSGDIPVCEFNLKLSPDEINNSEWSLKQLLFVQAVYNAQQQRYDRREYDLLEDSMLRLQEYVGIETDEIQELLDADLVRHDTDYPHRMYSVSVDGRSVIGESYRQGVDYGHGKGDLEESSEHVFGVELGIRLLEQEYQADPESDVAVVRPYHELRKGTLPAAAFMGDGEEIEEITEGYEQRRLDVAGLDEDGNVVVALEVERVNNDFHRAVPADFEKMAACDPEEAIWIVMSRTDGHKILEALNDPLEGEPRVEKSYSENTPPQHFKIDTAGMTRVYPAGYVQDCVLD